MKAILTFLYDIVFPDSTKIWNAFFLKSAKRIIQCFFPLNLPFLGVWEKTEWSWCDIFRTKLVRIQDWMAMNYHVIEKGKACPKSQETQPLEGTAFVWQRNVFQRGWGDLKWVDMFFFFLFFFPFLNDGIWFTRSPVLCFRKLPKGTPRRGRFSHDDSTFFLPEKLYMAENLAPSAFWHLFFNFLAKHGLAFKNFWVMMPV